MFFPHDFYHPIANVFFALTDGMQRSRMSDPRHRANHGYLPDSDAEQAFAILLDRSRRATVREGELIDLAPSLLEFMGRTPPESMKGRRLFGG
jgi:bisphosphoglycerate-independent phosphoglycerate mutase (AlkP superfamily)